MKNTLHSMYAGSPAPGPRQNPEREKQVFFFLGVDRMVQHLERSVPQSAKTFFLTVRRARVVPGRAKHGRLRQCSVDLGTRAFVGQLCSHNTHRRRFTKPVPIDVPLLTDDRHDKLAAQVRHTRQFGARSQLGSGERS